MSCIYELSFTKFFDFLLTILSTMSIVKLLIVLNNKFLCFAVTFLNKFKAHENISLFDINIGYCIPARNMVLTDTLSVLEILISCNFL